MYLVGGAIVVAVGMVLLYEHLFLSVVTPEPSVRNRSPVHVVFWEGVVIDAILVLLGLGSAGIGFWNLCQRVRLECDPSTGMLTIARSRLFWRSIATFPVQGAELLVGPHEEPVQKSTMRCYVVLLEYGGDEPLVMFASGPRRRRDARAAIAAAERWMDALSIRCKVFADDGLDEAIEAAGG